MRFNLILNAAITLSALTTSLCFHLKSFHFLNRSLTKSGLYGSENESLDSLLQKVKENLSPGSLVVIKYGGHAMENEELKQFFCEDIAGLSKIGIFPVIVHGGGPQIAKMLSSLNIESKFIQGLRVTDDKTMEVAQMVLCGSINKDIVSRISVQNGVRGAIGLSGLDSKLIRADVIQKKSVDENGVESIINLGRVGEPVGVNTDLLIDLLKLQLIPVIAPIGCGEDGASLNINADTAAGAVAEALKADRLLLLTDVTGVLDKNKQLLEIIESNNLSNLINDGTISGGMIPKLETATGAVNKGVKTVSIMDGRVRHCVLKALSGEIFGTKIIQG